MVDSEPRAMYGYLIPALDSLSPGYLHLMNAMFPAELFPDWPRGVLDTFGNPTCSPIVANRGYDAASAEAELRAGRADFISFGTPFISNPGLPARIENGNRVGSC
jgi:N-ethylmaleimide reductase